MIFPYKYTYLLMGIVFFVIWLILFLWKKDTRKEMLFTTILFAIAGPIADIFYTIDWWNPETITGTRIGVESIFVGGMIGGVSAIIYEDFFKKKIIKRKKKVGTKKELIIPPILILAVILFLATYLIIKNSFLATLVALLIPTFYIWFKRSDLIPDSIFSGILLVLVASISYGILNLLTPGWVEQFWLFKNVPNVIIFNLPLDDLAWYFSAGLFIGPLYEYWKEIKFK